MVATMSAIEHQNDRNDIFSANGKNGIGGQLKDPIASKTHHPVIRSKGTLIDGGASGIVERLPTGDAVKSPWPGHQGDDCHRDMRTEFEIYTRLGPHPRLVRVISWDAENCVLTMEYMENGDLKKFILAKNDSISSVQRILWAQQAAEGLQLVHAANIVHCDVEPRNFLLGTDLNLKIADFSGSSIDGRKASACVSPPFLHPDFDWRRQPVIQDDLFSLGSLIYFIMTGQYPFAELASEEVEAKYNAREFPDVGNIMCGYIIKRCWNLEAGSAQEVLQYLKDTALSASESNTSNINQTTSSINQNSINLLPISTISLQSSSKT